MFLVHAEHDRLLEAVAARLQELRDPGRDQLGALIQHQGAIEVLGVIDPVLDLLAVAIDGSLLWPVALDVEIDVALDDLVGGQEAIADALLQGMFASGTSSPAMATRPERCWRPCWPSMRTRAC